VPFKHQHSKELAADRDPPARGAPRAKVCRVLSGQLCLSILPPTPPRDIWAVQIGDDMSRCEQDGSAKYPGVMGPLPGIDMGAL
jgi:hypothetical protein